jgi:hypothetical protein
VSFLIHASGRLKSRESGKLACTVCHKLCFEFTDGLCGYCKPFLLYRTLYRIQGWIPSFKQNCVEDFLGDLVNHSVVRGSILAEDEKEALEADVTVEELDEAVNTCNLNSAPGIDGISNRYHIRKFWPFFWENRYCGTPGKV